MKLRCENLVKKYGVRTVVKGVSMEVNQGEIVGFLGPNGAGKTTSFYMITGQVVPNEGRIFLEDEDITGLPMFKRSQKGIGYLPQEASVFRKMSVEDNIMSVMEMVNIPKKVRRERLEELKFIIAKLKYRNIGVIITDHNVGETLAITDRDYLLYEGTILMSGTPEELAADDDVRTKYLGSGFILKKSKAVERAQAEAAARAAAEAPATQNT